jgi:integrase
MAIVGTKQVPTRNRWTLLVRDGGVGPSRSSARHVTRLGRKHTLCPHFFLDKQGKAMSCHTVRATFQKLRRLAGIRRQGGAIYQPRMHDLRYTFAVHRLTSWFKQRADMNRLLPALAAYIGQVGLGSTERYLSMTPEPFPPTVSRLPWTPISRRPTV